MDDQASICPDQAVGVHANDDVGDIERLVGIFFDAFTSGSGIDHRMDALRQAMLPGARIIRTCGLPPEACDVESFLAPRRALLTEGRLTDFREEPQGGRIDLAGDIAHWFGRYAKRGLMDGAPYAGAGTKSIQLVRTDSGWRISAVAWDDDPS